MPSAYVDVRSHHFAVSRMSRQAFYELNGVLKGLRQWGFVRLPNGKFIREVLRVFAAHTDNKEEVRFPISLLPVFEEHFKSVGLGDYVISKPIPYEPAFADFRIKPQWQEREHQVPVIEYIVNPGEPVSKFVSLATGQGKSFCSMAAMAKLKLRTMIIVRPMYMEKWREDILRTYDIDPTRIMMVSGGKALMTLIQLGMEDNIDADIIIVSNKTLQLWIKQYLEFYHDSTQLGYECFPQDFLRVTKTGILLKDEVHQDFHLNTMLDCFTDVSKSISLSATLLSDDDFINRMYEVVYPKKDRYIGPPPKKHVESAAVFYRIDAPNKVRTQEYGQPTYSHTAFEKSIMRYRLVFENYLRLIYWSVRNSFVEHTQFKKGDRCLVFCASIDLSTKVAEYLQRRFPDFVVKRYVDDDPYEHLREGEIIVSTVLSAGTAVDIDRLLSVVLTTAIKSSQSNIQGFGRLREMKDGRTPWFWYLVCEDIPKHREYHERKQVLLKEKSAKYKTIRYNGGSI